MLCPIDERAPLRQIMTRLYTSEVARKVAALNTFTHPRFRLAWILVAIGVFNGLFWTLFRGYYENRQLATQITLDYEDTASLADAYGVSQKQLLADFKKRGATSLAIYNQTLGTLRDNARIAISPREVAEKIYRNAGLASVPASYRYVITSDDAALLDQIYGRINDQSPPGTPPLRLQSGAQSLIAVSASKQLFNDASMGFDPQQVAFVRDNGYIPTARVSNSLNLTPARLNQTFDDIQKSGAKVVIFADDEVLGYESLMSSVAREMRNRGLIFTNIEFSKQRGSREFAMSTDGDLVRLHTVTGDEAARADPEVLVERFVRAARERDMRVLYVRLLRQQKGEPNPVKPGDVGAPLTLKQTPYQQNLDFMQRVSEDLTRPPLPGGFLRPAPTLGAAQPFGDYPTSYLAPNFGTTGARIIRYLMLFLSGVGVVGMTLLGLNLFYDWSQNARRNWLIAGLVIVAILSCSQGKGAQLIALQAGIMASVVAMLWGGLPLIWDGLRRPKNNSVAQTAWFGFGILLGTTLLALALSLNIVALLNEWRYLSKADEFFGEKATQFLPLIIIPLAFLGELFPHRVIQHGAEPGLKLMKTRFRRAIDRPFTVQIAVLSLFILAGGYLWMARFGNESGMEISPIELKMRAVLERVFVTRPRTKEIFMGHPAFIISMWFMLRERKMLAWGVLVLATIGQSDVVNTMCHIHTPVFFDIWRSLAGIVIGAFVGAIALYVLNWLGNRMPKTSDRKTPNAGATDGESLNGHAENAIEIEKVAAV